MGKKENAYQVFVRHEYNRMKREGMNPEYSSLFGLLSDKWKGMSDESKAYYKEKAANPNFGGQDSYHRTRPGPTQFSESKASTTGSIFDQKDNQPCGIEVDIDEKFIPNKESVEDCKPNFKEERGLKRGLEVDVFEDQKDGQSHEQPKKKWKEKSGLGKGFPNFKNITRDPGCDGERYADYHLLQMRERCQAIVQTRDRELLTKPLYTISCNVLCKYYFEGKDGKEVKFVPLEIAIAPYNIEKGQFAAPYHAIIDSGRPPANFWCDTYDHMSSTHKIKVTQDGTFPPEARKDYRTICREMQKYTEDGERTVLVADSQDIEQVKKCIEWLYEMAERIENPVEKLKSIAKPSSWTILPLVDFVAAAYNFVHCNMLRYESPKFTLHYYLKIRLESSIWDYDQGLMCSYHKKSENQTRHCARSCAIRVFNALQLTLEEIYKKFKIAEELSEKRQQESQEPGPDPDPAAAKPTRIPAQQVQQPLHFPEEKQPPPIIEEVARREEMRQNYLRQHQSQLDNDD